MFPAALLPTLLLCTSQAPAERVDAFLRGEMEARKVPATAVAVVRDGEVVLARAWGKANVELGVDAGPDTVFELLSVSKQFTAAGVLLLVEDGKLALGDRIVERLDGLPASWKEITVAQLLAHTSGIPDYTDRPGWFETIRLDRTPAELLATVESAPLDFAPGTRWRYSNSNYYVLGLLIEKLAQRPLDAFLAERVFAPLGMQATRMESFEALIPRRAAGYHLAGGALVNAPWVSPTHKWAAGAFVSSVADMARWAQALDAGKLLPTRALEQMTTPAKLADGTSADYGFANELAFDHGHRVAGHQGGGLAFNATLLRFPDDRLSVVVLCNQTQAPSRAWARRIASFWLPDLAEDTASAADPDPAFTAIFRGVLTDAAQGKVDAARFAPAVREQMQAFIAHTGPRFLGPLGALESLAPLETKQPPGKRVLRYRAMFAKGALVWTVELDRDGAILAMEPEQE